MLEQIYLHCYKCNIMVLKNIDTNDKIYEMECSNCKNKSLEVSFKKINQPTFKEMRRHGQSREN